MDFSEESQGGLERPGKDKLLKKKEGGHHGRSYDKKEEASLV